MSYLSVVNRKLTYGCESDDPNCLSGDSIIDSMKTQKVAGRGFLYS
jgi:hypothetical protein